MFPAPKPARREPKPRKRLNPRNEKRARQRHEDDFGPKADWVRSLACVVSGSEGTKNDPIVVAHVKGRGAGGDSRHIVPMLASLHQIRHDIGENTFDVNHDCDLEAAADIIEMRWQAFAQSEARPCPGLRSVGRRPCS
jgi:hypothetical protein